MTAKQIVLVGKRSYDLEPGDDGRWVVSRGGIPTGYLHVLANGEAAAYALANDDAGASEELLAVLEAAKKEAWWR